MPHPTTLVLRNARIHTFGSHPEAEALALRDGAILAVGSQTEVWQAVGSDAPSVDLEGRVVLPGLTDAHVHWGGFALARRRLRIDPSDGLPEVQRAVRQSGAETESREAWILGRGWDHDAWGRWPHATDLDQVAPNQPVALTRKDGHVMWLNSRAMQLCGIDADTVSPPGGEIARGPDGQPTGILKENAKQLASAAIPSATAAERQAAMIDAWPAAWCRGLTGLHDMGLGRRSLFRDLATLRDSGELGARFVWYLQEDELDEALGLGLRSGMGDHWLRIGGLKLFLDGTLGSQTAAMLADYEGQAGNRGLPLMPPERFDELVTRATAGGLATAVHAIGDRANRVALDGFEAVKGQAKAAGLHQRVEHAQVLAPEDIGRFKALGVAASMQPIHATADMAMADRYWGPRAAGAYAWRSLADAGALLAFGSDAPIESLDVFAGVHAAVTRKDGAGRPEAGWRAEQCLDVRQALAAYTIGAARAAGVEQDLGSLEAGKRADLIVLDRDPLSMPVAALPNVNVLGTMIEGVWVWQASGAMLGGPRQEP